MVRYVSKETALGHPMRQAILDLVATHPGISLTQLAQQISCKPSTILWHTGKLRKADLLRTAKVAGLRVFYLPNGGIDLRERVVERTRLANDLARRIHEVVAQRPGITFNGLASQVGANVSALRWHLGRLVADGLLCLGDEPGRALHYYARHHPGPPCLSRATAA